MNQAHEIYQETLNEHMSGESETSYLLDLIADDTQEGGLYHKMMQALLLSLDDHEQAGELIEGIYEQAARMHAAKEAESCLPEGYGDD